MNPSGATTSFEPVYKYITEGWEFESLTTDWLYQSPKEQKDNARLFQQKNAYPTSRRSVVQIHHRVPNLIRFAVRTRPPLEWWRDQVLHEQLQETWWEFVWGFRIYIEYKFGQRLDFGLEGRAREFLPSTPNAHKCETTVVGGFR